MPMAYREKNGDSILLQAIPSEPTLNPVEIYHVFINLDLYIVKYISMPTLMEGVSNG